MTTPVRRTSDWMAVVRAEESAQPDAYHADPCAEVFVTEEARQVVAAFKPFHPPSEVVPVRARLGDKTLLSSGVRQAVSLGAGSDCRPYRLPLEPSFAYYEVDLPGQLSGKAEALAQAGYHPRCRVVCVETDLRSPPPSVAPGFDASMATHWIVEGVFYYLTSAEAESVIGWITRQSGPGSWLTFDIPHPRFFTDPDHQPFLREMAAHGVPFAGAVEDPVAWLAPHGWTAEAATHRDIAEGRCPWLAPLPPRLRGRKQDIWLTRAHR
ncbi:class I SAM-dependent methyltransferase [Nonomuraea sp. NPDC050536]|uniref:class I SAM-dependent methyltransferase n=1 Tax=Nonomuraea sp. NPDC050536 TaxID=3364366 RepID=UPI0037C7A012